MLMMMVYCVQAISLLGDESLTNSTTVKIRAPSSNVTNGHDDASNKGEGLSSTTSDIVYAVSMAASIAIGAILFLVSLLVMLHQLVSSIEYTNCSYVLYFIRC